MSRAAALRFIAGVLVLWTSARMIMLARPDGVSSPAFAAAGLSAAVLAAGPLPRGFPVVGASAAAIAAAGGPPASGRPIRAARHRHGEAPIPLDRIAPALAPTPGPAVRIASAALPADARDGTPPGPAASFASPYLSIAPATLRPLARRWSGEAYLFARAAGDRDATGGTLGGGQAAARIAYRLDPAGRFALFVRGYAPLHGRGAEISGGVEWHPLDDVPLRLAVERRQRVAAGGRDAWMASVAGGVDARPLPGGLRLDAYAQSGVVGANARDLFADGSVRIGKPLPLAAGSVTVGAGAWGAAQPGVSRLDLGPEAALRLPAGHAGLTLALDWRLRAAGRARPGSGPALTLAADF